MVGPKIHGMIAQVCEWVLKKQRVQLPIVTEL